MLTDKPLVSVMTPCFNHEKYLDDYFDGLLNQTYNNVELIIYDDGSADASWEKILSYKSALEKKFTRVICERHENMGPLRELILAVSLVTGKYFGILDSDDYYLPTKIEDNVTYLEAHPDEGAVYSDSDFVYEDHVKRSVLRAAGTQIPKGRIFDDLLKGNFIMTPTVCCRAEIFKRCVDIEGYVCKGYLMGDYPMWLDMAAHTSFGYIDKPLVRYRVLSESMSHSGDPRKSFIFNRSARQIARDYASKYRGPGSPEARRADLEYYHWMFYEAYKRRFRGECEEAYRWLLTNAPHRYDFFDGLRVFSLRSPVLWFLVSRADRCIFYLLSDLGRAGRRIRKIRGKP